MGQIVAPQPINGFLQPKSGKTKKALFAYKEPSMRRFQTHWGLSATFALAGFLPSHGDAPDFSTSTQAVKPMQAPPIAESMEPLSDLTLGNLFSAGWNESWVKRPHPDGTPDLTLLRVQSNLLLQSLRTDAYLETPTSASGDKRVEYASTLVEYALNRRLMLGALGTFQEVDHQVGGGRNGWTYGGLTRLQLIDREATSYALNWKVTAPNRGLGDRQTLTSFALAGWHDLTALGLKHMGLYWHIQEETLLGPRKPSTRQNDLTYDLSLARSWTSPGRAIGGNLSTFVEAYSKTDLDGAHRGRTVATVTPGTRATFFHHHIVMFGVDLPVTAPRPYDALYRVTYIFSF